MDRILLNIDEGRSIRKFPRKENGKSTYHVTDTMLSYKFLSIAYNDNAGKAGFSHSL